MIIDTHSHLSFKAYDKDRDEVIKRTQENEVVCIDVGTKYETSKNAVELAERNENIYSAIGLYPIHIKTDLLKLKMDESEGGFVPFGEEFDKQKYLELAKSSKKIVAIGEIGLDYYYLPKSKTKRVQYKELQKNVFVKQLELAQELDLPVMVHTRMAHEDTIGILNNYSLQTTHYKLSGVIHGFVGTWDNAKKYLELGFYLGINGIIFKFNENSEAVRLGQVDVEGVIKNCPIDRIVVETDCPYLTPPQENKDNRNEPIFVKHIIQKIADIKGLSYEEVASVTTQNAKKLICNIKRPLRLLK